VEGPSPRLLLLRWQLKLLLLGVITVLRLQLGMGKLLRPRQRTGARETKMDLGIPMTINLGRFQNEGDVSSQGTFPRSLVCIEKVAHSHGVLVGRASQSA